MSYQVLARKWRPKRFSELVGQEHVVRALANALDAGRTHHAYLFAGTRGIGKTTIARIFAKSINCEQGESAEPCGTCAVCTAVDEGRFVDLLEIDAASNTGVDDVRELIENAQYAPSRGRFKVYLIDEVHMLSRSAFNALLKTLEEPPDHVKFLLATTDPERLPVTVLSRCLKFNLKRLRVEQIAAQLTHILGAEGIEFEDAAVEALALAADGSMRDGLSLLDQALAYGGNRLDAAQTRAMLGTVEYADVAALAAALGAGDGAALLAGTERIALHAPDFGVVLDQFAALLHRVQLQQLVPEYRVEAGADREAVSRLAGELAAETVQLYYQLATHGRRELELAPDPQTGFEMVLLRMLAFRPAGTGGPAAGTVPPRAAAARPRPSPASDAAPAPAPPARPHRAEQRVAEPAPAPAAMPVAPVPDANGGGAEAFVDPARCGSDWHAWVAAAALEGPAAELARNVLLVDIDGNRWSLALRPQLQSLAVPPTTGILEAALAAATGCKLRLEFVPREGLEDTPADRQVRRHAARIEEAERSLAADPVLRSLEQELGARIQPGSVRAL